MLHLKLIPANVMALRNKQWECHAHANLILWETMSAIMSLNFLFCFVGSDYASERLYCKYTSPINIMTMICSLTSVAAVGFNRFVLLCMSKSIYNKLTKRSSLVITIAAIWIWSFLITLPPMVGYGEFGYHVKFHTCFFPAYDEKSWMYGTIFCCVLGVFPPVASSCFFYGKILLKLRENRANLMKHYRPKKTLPTQEMTSSSSGESNEQEASTEKESLDPAEENSTTSNNTTSQGNKKNRSNALLLRQNAHQRRSTLMLVTIFVIIVVCWLPISVSFILDRKNTLPSTVYVCFVVLTWLNSCINIFIYAGMNLQFRKGYFDILCKPFKRSSVPLTTSSNLASDIRVSFDNSITKQ